MVILLFSGFFEQIDTWLHDNWLEARLSLSKSSDSNQSFFSGFFPVANNNDDVVVVVIDDRSILGIPGLYQGNRSIYAQALRNLTACSPAAIALDVFFAAPSGEDPDQDADLIDAISTSGKVVLRAFRRDDKRMTPPFPELARSTVSAPTYFKTHRDKSIRSVSLVFASESEKTIPSFQAELLRTFMGLPADTIEFSSNAMLCRLPNQSFSVPLLNNEFMLLNYDVPLRSFKTVSFFDVYNGQIAPEDFKNKAIIIGFANSMTEEKLFTPISGNEFSPFLNAIVFRNLINRSYLTPPAPLQGKVVAIIVLAVFMLGVFRYLQPVSFLFMSILAVPALLAYSMLSLTLYSKLVDVAASIFAIIASLVFTVGKKYYTELSEKLRIKTAFQHYVTASVVNEILKNPAKLNLHGEERNLTIFFSDIEGFTSLSEGMSPLDVVSLLNEYLTEMTDIIFKFDGLLDKYEGDAIMSVFGAPIDQKDHAIRACRCAIENQKALARLRNKWKTEGKPEIKARIGINTGVVVVGNMGSTMRFDYTVIGDNVNLAARLETANKLFNTEILVSEETANLAESVIISRFLTKLKVIGKSNAVNVYEVLADRNDTDKNALALAEKAKKAYESAQTNLNNRNFAEAEQILTAYLAEHPDDKPARSLHSRVKGFLIVPPPPGWENIVNQDLK